MVLARVTAECGATFARYTLDLVDETAHKLSRVATGCTLRDLDRVGIARGDVERLRVGEAIDLEITGSVAQCTLARFKLAEVRKYCPVNVQDEITAILGVK